MTIHRSEFKCDKVPDADPDLSWLGEYSSSPGPHGNGRIIDRKARGDLERNQYRYFHPANAETADDAERDYMRMEAYNRGDWWMVGIRAAVILDIPCKAGGTITQRITSPGLWGVESDSGADYIAEVYAGECDQLAEMLEAMGITVEGVANEV